MGNIKIWTISGQCNCYIVADEKRQAAVVDPGASVSSIMAALKSEELSAARILLTHGHYDHIESVAALAVATGACVYIHEDDAECLSSTGKSLKSWLTGDRIGVTTTPEYEISFLRDGMELDIGDLKIKVIHTPGHTRGSCCFACEDALLTGDTLFDGDCGRCDLPGGDSAVLLQSLGKLAALDDACTVYPGHEGFTTLGREKLHNTCFQRACEAAGRKSVSTQSDK